MSFIERTIKSFIATSEYAASAERIAASGGALQRVDPRVKVAGLVGLIVAVAASRRLVVIACMFGLALLMAVLSKVSLPKLGTWIWIPALLFTGLIAAPAIFLTPGSSLVEFHGLTITSQGVRSALFLVSRAETTATLSALLVLTTPWPWVMKSLRVFKCPMVVVAILGMTYRYVFVILQTALDMFESRKSRTVGVLDPVERRRLAASAAGVLLSKSFPLSGDVHLAMQSRGFRGEVYLVHDFRAKTADWLWLIGFTVVALGSIWWGL